MSANMRIAYQNVPIEDYINWTGEAERTMVDNNKAILNMCLTNGVMGRKDQLKLRQLYPNLYKDVQKFLAQKKRGTIYIHKEEGKPQVVNIFIHQDVKNTTTDYHSRRVASSNIKRYIRAEKINNSFVYIDANDNKHRRMIEDTLKYMLNWSTYIDKLKLENTTEEQ